MRTEGGEESVVRLFEAFPILLDDKAAHDANLIHHTHMKNK